MGFPKKVLRKFTLVLTVVFTVVGCALGPVVSSGPGKRVCDSYLFLSICVQDVVGDGSVDMMFFTDAREIYMYRAGQEEVVSLVMPFHRCAIPLSPEMQDVTDRILSRENLRFSEEVAITRKLIDNYFRSKPEIDACNDSFDDGPKKPQQEFLFEDDDWEDE